MREVDTVARLQHHIWRRMSLKGYRVALVIIAVMLALLAGYDYMQRASYLEQSRVEQETTSKAIAFQVEQSLLAVDLVLRSVTERVVDARLSTVAQLREKMGTREIFDLIQSRKSGIPQLSVVSIVDKNGDMVNFTRNHPPLSAEGKAINLAERDYFKAHLSDAALKLFISAPVRNKGTGTWTFYLTRKIENPSGEMIGLVLAGIETAYFEDYFRAIAEAGKRYTIWLETGMSIAQFPKNELPLGRTIPLDAPLFKTLDSGLRSAIIPPTYDARLSSNSLEYRILAPTRVSGYPLIVNVRAGESVIFSAWQQTRIWVASFGLALSVMVLLAAWGWQRTLRQRETIHSQQRAAQAMHEALVLSSTDAFIRFDPSGRVLEWSPVATQMFGWSPAQAIGRLLVETIVPLRYHESHVQSLARMVRGDNADTLGKVEQWSACRADGTEISVELLVTPVQLEGGLNYIVFVRDVTERRQAEERLRDRTEQLNAIFSMSPDAFVSFDLARCVKSVNPAFVRMTGLVESELLGLDEFAFLERLSRICVPEKNSRGMVPLRAMKQAGAAGTAVPGAHKRLQRIELANPGKRVLEVALRESNSATVSQILYMHDVTHETEVERLKSEFVSNAAHELRTPMASIYGFTELLLAQDIGQADRRDFLLTIFRQSELVVSIINDLLDLARIEARRGKDFVFERVNIGTLLSEIKAGFKLPAGRVPPKLQLPYGALWMRADRHKLTQAVTNVLSNAYKYSPANSAVSIEIALPEADVDHASDSRTPMAGIRITDHGIGMTHEQLRRVFERFYRADLSGKIPGTGLGMSIVHEIIVLHEGEVSVDSAIGAGTTVTIWLPATANAAVLPQRSLETAAL